MHKQLSKKSHKQTESSVDDFMKHIRKYNLQSERYISPKPLLYMYTNPSRNFTLHTLDKSRSKSKTLSNKKQQHSNSKKSSSKTIMRKVEQLLSSNFSKENIHHKKSLSSISNVNKNLEKSAKKLNRSTAEVDLTKSKAGLKSKLTEFKLKPMNVVTTAESESKKKGKKSQQKNNHYHPETSTSHRPFIQSSIPSESSQIYPTSIPNPAELIESYSNKLFKTQLYLESTKHKLGSFLCRKFQTILNEIVESLVENLKRSLNELEKEVEDRVSKRLKQEYEHKINEKSEEVKELEHVCEKMTKKFTEMLHKQFYSNTLIYRLRLKGIDIDKEFGHAVWGVDDLGGLGYRDEGGNGSEEDEEQESEEEEHQQQHNRKHMNIINSSHKHNPLVNILESDNDPDCDNDENEEHSENSSHNNNFEFHPHPSSSNKKNRKEKFHNNFNGLTKMEMEFEHEEEEEYEIINVEDELEEEEEEEEYEYHSEEHQQLKQINRSL